MNDYKPGQVYEDVNGRLWCVNDEGLMCMWLGNSWYDGPEGVYPGDLEDENGPLVLVREAPPEIDDPVNHPSHYAEGWSNGAQVIDIAENLPFNRGAAVKYLARAGKKGGPEKELEDLKKAQWFVNREVERLAAGSDHQ